MPHSNEDVKELSYEEARDELVAIVAKLEAGAATLDESLGLWERGEALGARCQELLDGAKDRITAATDDELDPEADAGVVGIIPADDEDDE
ncbi:exodeoxyribonuclease VII small subunit [Demequina globuliformis]|uniref:exodeoxyribonuclease VII small subunit n=1 Tax=Demequina globuliformis TaxID=676202 RepID=UPI0007849C09|nr:exodeoxyribonuclease VII small subunit [Demequina globuliformis]